MRSSIDPVVSPVTGKSGCRMMGRVDTIQLSHRYATYLGISVKKTFEGIDQLSVYQCPDTGYCFYYPFNVSGDHHFYEQLQKYDWYYMDWKWEHQIVYEKVLYGQKVLEIGCGKASFISRLSNEKNSLTVGLELNPSAAKGSLPIHCTVENKSIESYSSDHAGLFDWVCTFQVLEHVTDIKSFLTSAIQCLKPNGKLVLSVPNNKSFIRHSYWPILNMPPHHMGLWDEFSLKSLENFFDIEYEGCYFEELQPQHDVLFLTNTLLHFLPKNRVTVKISNLLARMIPKFWLNYFRTKIVGHTVLVIFKKAGS